MYSIISFYNHSTTCRKQENEHLCSDSVCGIIHRKERVLNNILIRKSSTLCFDKLIVMVEHISMELFYRERFLHLSSKFVPVPEQQLQNSIIPQLIVYDFHKH